jgi:hypothetical protein
MILILYSKNVFPMHLFVEEELLHILDCVQEKSFFVVDNHHHFDAVGFFASMFQLAWAEMA